MIYYLFQTFRVLIFEFPPSWCISLSESSNIRPSLPFSHFLSPSRVSVCGSLIARMLLYYPRCILEFSVEAMQRVAAAPAVGLKFPPATMRRSRASMIVLACSHSCSTLHACLDAGVIQVEPRCDGLDETALLCMSNSRVIIQNWNHASRRCNRLLRETR